VGGLKNIPVGCVFEKTFWLGGPKQEISKKVTISQDDDFVGALKKNIQNRLTLVGLRPGLKFNRPYGTQHPHP
jgi:hypothetical protein